MKKIESLTLLTLTVLLSLIIASPLQAQKEQAFVQGNLLYEKAQYTEALTQYQSALQEGYEAWELYYNMGNTYYRLVDYPRALLYYEKALKLNPKNNDIQNNITLAEGKCLDRFTPLPAFFLYSWWEKLCGLFHLTVWAVLILLFFALALVSAGLYIRTANYKGKRAGFYLCLAFSLLFILSFAFAWGNRHEAHIPKAIVMEQSVNVKVMPEEKSETKFILHEGTKVRIEDNIGNYAKVRIKNGSRGWLPVSALEMI